MPDRGPNEAGVWPAGEPSRPPVSTPDQGTSGKAPERPPADRLALSRRREDLLALLRDHEIHEELVGILAEAMTTANEAALLAEEARDRAEAERPAAERARTL